MVASGLVVHLSSDPGAADRAAGAIRGAGAFALGRPVGRRLPVAVAADTEAEAHGWHDWLAGLPGVERVDVAFVQTDGAARAGGADER